MRSPYLPPWIPPEEESACDRFCAVDVNGAGVVRCLSCGDYWRRRVVTKRWERVVQQGQPKPSTVRRCCSHELIEAWMNEGIPTAELAELARETAQRERTTCMPPAEETADPSADPASNPISDPTPDPFPPVEGMTDADRLRRIAVAAAKLRWGRSWPSAVTPGRLACLGADPLVAVIRLGAWSICGSWPALSMIAAPPELVPVLDEAERRAVEEEATPRVLDRLETRIRDMLTCPHTLTDEELARLVRCE